ncbi:class I SAM-dependent methyltransferase [Lysobacter sp. KIS68-7]|uniref:class I SAM-dependent methyltransferase n=1 Tax=Lysobacter sp. KIS68-7 TaxID=2904252 RepID=UPI001E57909D|nr:class I SAM-dependent methyltransferase [Lysobacter sp. KIS68-7]UHQ19529.1 class I SAM-dependent methyltransferase [Lysobacter sp. KIS68-7]
MPRSIHPPVALPSMSDSSPVTFPAQRLDIIADVQADHFWHAPRHALLLDLVCHAGLADGASIVDIGCGTGAFVSALVARGFDARGIDPFAGARGLDPRRIATGQAEALPCADGSMAAACAFDVLEHVDDARALAEMHRILVPGGRLFVSVPAHAWLWSARDERAGHRRRYTRAMLRKRVEAAGFSVERLFGYQWLLLPMLAAARWWANARGIVDTDGEDRPGRLANGLLRALNRFEVRAGRLVRPPTGSSLVLVARRTAMPPASEGAR